ncbi:MAG: FAD-dependent oxidoreductase [Gammaproteobacteria bacterium]|jgi:D-hydroxyproline dehydrogenase subunit alpha|nr:FAD-dependent oxidoreductase [Candidatus Neomarinimicrobiota bacterium]MBT6331187.1 FAD-dependent oxidoreductase [Gammaproteobacteria bacterium]
MKIKFQFENIVYSANSGDSIASALISNKIFEINNNGLSKRGIFCGMGVCHECLVEVNGENNVRACMRKLDNNAIIFKQKQIKITKFKNDSSYQKKGRESFSSDLLIIGGGIGGLSAALAASNCGVNTILIDDREKLGGQFCKQPIIGENATSDDQVILGKKLINKVINNGVKVFTNSSVFAIFENKEILAIKDNELITFRPKKIIFSTGAYEKGYPVKGWTLPGVMTTGAMQGLLKGYNVLAGKKILMCGNGPFILHVAKELKKGGAIIIAISEKSSKPNIFDYKIMFQLLLNSFKLFLKGIRYLLFLKLNGIPIYYNHEISSIEQNANGLTATIMNTGGNDHKSFEVDCICLGYGFNSSNNMLRYLNCRHDYNSELNCLVTFRYDDLQTTVKDIYAIGDCVKISGAQVAELEGNISGYNVAESLGYEIVSEYLKEKNLCKIKLHKLEKFQNNLWKLYKSNNYNLANLNKEIEICRCEGIKYSALKNALENGFTSMSELKLKTRVGMGPCQGRYCGQIVLDILKHNCGVQIKESDFFTPRIPFIPLNIEHLTELVCDE